MPARAEIQHQVMSAFRGEFAPVKVGVLYKFGMLVVAVAMVVLPAIYVCLVAAAGWALYWHATHNLAFFQDMRPKFAVFAYGVPLFALAVLFFFMIKPLFAPRAKPPPSRALKREEEPLLFVFVERVCHLVGAPVPREIRVDCQVNASASFRRGVWSMVGNDLVLTLGLPLAGGLGLRHFAGVLAHELGHFAQGGAMRLTYIVRSINAWFARVVQERDAWDELLVRCCEETDDPRLQFPVYVARFMVWLTRRVLWVLMLLGHAVSCFMLRQMGYDADRYQARLSGSDCQAESMRLLPKLAVAHNGAANQLFGRDLKEGRLVDDFVGLSLLMQSKIPPEVQAKIEASTETDRTGLFDTHPAARDRIDSARAESAAGVFRCALPATALFADFAHLSQAVTQDWYDQLLGEERAKAKIVPLSSLLEKQQAVEEEGKAAARYFQGALSVLRPPLLNPEHVHVPQTAEEAVAALGQAREAMLAALPTHRDVRQRYAAAESCYLQSLQAGALQQAGLAVSPATFGLKDAKPETIKAGREQGFSQREEQGRQLAQFEELLAARMRAVLGFVRAPFVEEEAAAEEGAEKGAEKGASPRAELEWVVASYAALLRALPEFARLREEHVTLLALLQNLERGKGMESYVDAAMSQTRFVHRRLDGILKSLGETPYPFEHESGGIALREYLLDKLPPETDVGGVYGAAEHMLEQVTAVYFRILGRFAFVAEQVEAAVGLEPLPEPQPEPEVPEKEEGADGAVAVAGAQA